MTRKQMITACVEDQIKRGIIDGSRKASHIQVRLTGKFKMSLSECQEWYNATFSK